MLPMLGTFALVLLRRREAVMRSWLEYTSRDRLRRIQKTSSSASKLDRQLEREHIIRVTAVEVETAIYPCQSGNVRGPLADLLGHRKANGLLSGALMQVLVLIGAHCFSNFDFSSERITTMQTPLKHALVCHFISKTVVPSPRLDERVRCPRLALCLSCGIHFLVGKCQPRDITTTRDNLLRIFSFRLL